MNKRPVAMKAKLNHQRVNTAFFLIDISLDMKKKTVPVWDDLSLQV